MTEYFDGGLLMFNNRGEEKQRFSLRKLSIGVASVLLGVTFMAYNGQTVHADTTETSVSATNNTDAEAATSENSKAAENTNDQAAATKAVATADQNKAAVKADQPAAKEVEHKAASQDQAAADKQVVAKDVNKDQTTAKDQSSKVPKLTDDILKKFLGLDKPDALSDSQLKAMGLDRDTFLGDGAGSYVAKGVKYKATGLLTVYTDETRSKVLATYKFVPVHDKQGQVITADEMSNNLINNNVNLHNDKKYGAIAIELNNAEVEVLITPMQTAGTIYITKGHNLDSADAMRGLTGEMKAGSAEWVNSTTDNIDINKAGTYTGAVVEAMYKNGTGTTIGVTVVVVDLQGKTIYTTSMTQFQVQSAALLVNQLIQPTSIGQQSQAQLKRENLQVRYK
jgi:hypothetical protein